MLKTTPTDPAVLRMLANAKPLPAYSCLIPQSKDLCAEVTCRGRECAGVELDYRDSHGYPIIVGVLRAAWEYNFSAVPKGCDVRTTCGRDICVNPEHLMVASITVTEKIDDMRSGKAPRPEPRWHQF